MVEILYVLQIFYITLTEMGSIPSLVYREDVPRIFVDQKRDDLNELEKGGMSFVAYEDMFHSLSIYAMHLVTIEEEKIQLFIKVLNSKLQVLSVHMSSAGRSFDEVTNYVQ